MPISPKNPETASRFVRLLPLIVLLAVSMALAFGNFSAPEKERRKPSSIGYSAGNVDIPSIDGKTRFTSDLWNNKIVVVNVFASWCKPCLAEHPALMRLAQTGKVEMLGIAWKDKPDNAAGWLRTRGNPYHHIGVDEKGETTTALGLTGVPETLILDKHGKIAYHYKAAIDDTLVNSVILPMIEHLRQPDANPAQR
ncbi:MAG: redoxin family protein [Alphaproteobacteria bacterium]|nr:redoxin family protein [Alphaproteobacteria bacterium]